MKRATLIACTFALLAIGGNVAYHIHSAHKDEMAIRAIDAKIISQAVHEYTIHEGKPPKSLDDLVFAGYLKAIPGRPRYYDLPVTPPPALTHPKSTPAPSA